MANAVFTTKVLPSYDDIPELRYHFPKTYLNYVQRTVGDWIIYYEPRRESTEPGGTSGRSAYFATARVQRIEPDPKSNSLFYAFVSDYLEFADAVPFRSENIFPESALKKIDGTTNKGAFGRAVRLLPLHEFELILRMGLLAPSLSNIEASNALLVAESEPIYERKNAIIQRPIRDEAFTRNIQQLYASTCALTGLKIINGGGRCEIEAAHIRPIAENGPDSPRNGLALSRTVHWLFDRGIISLDNDGRILAAQEFLPEPVRRLLNPEGLALPPSDPSRRPHPVFLTFHREVVCRGKNLKYLK